MSMSKLHGLWTAAACVGTAHAQVDLFIAEYKFNDAQFSAVGIDGSNPRVLFDLPPALWLPLGMDFDAATQRFIWMDSAGTSKVIRSDIDGDNLAQLTTVPGFARGISRDATGRIYTSTNNTVVRLNADGSGQTVIYTGPTSDPLSNVLVDATNGHVYVGVRGEILRMNLDGGNIKTVVRGGSIIRAIGLDVANRSIYWIDSDTHTDFLARADLDGSGFEVLVDNTPLLGTTSGLVDLIVDPASGHVFYSDEFTNNITRTDLDGGNVTVIHTTPPGFGPYGLALSTGAPVQALNDCNGNGIADDIDIANGEPDCDNNGVPDSCQAEACPDRVTLLDNGSDAANFNGRALGVPSAWEVFQPFFVPSGGWRIGEIALDGYTVEPGSHLGFTVKLHPDNPDDAIPDETVTIASYVGGHFYYNTNQQNWVTIPLEAELEPGLYWVHIEANEPSVYWASVNLGLTGLPSLSRGSSGNFSNPAPAIALRIFEATACAADYNGDAVADILDFLDFFEDFAACENQPGPCGTLGDADFNGDSFVDILDFLDFFEAFSAGC